MNTVMATFTAARPGCPRSDALQAIVSRELHIAAVAILCPLVKFSMFILV